MRVRRCVERRGRHKGGRWAGSKSCAGRPPESSMTRRGNGLAEQLHAIADSEPVGEVGEWLIACENADELFDRVAGLRESSATGGGRQDR